MDLLSAQQTIKDMDSGKVTWDDNVRAQANKLIGGQSSGANTANYDNLISSMPKATDFTKGIQANETNAFNDYLNYLKGQPSSAQTYKANIEEAGIPNLQKAQSTLTQQLYSAEDTLRKLPENIKANNRNSIVTQNQLEGQILQASRPVQDTINTVGTALGRVSNAVSQGKADALTLTGLQQQDTAQFVDAYKTRLSLAQSQGQQALQAFIADNEVTLNLTLEKIHRGEQISDQEAQNAFQLMTLQKQAEISMKELEYQTENSGDSGKRYITLSDGATLYDTQTGQIVSENTKNFKGNTTGGGDWS